MGDTVIRFDYACKRCEKVFTIWSDEAKRCAFCGSRRVFKIFLTPPSVNTGTPAKIEKLAEQQIEAAGLSNYTNVGGSIKRTYKTDPKHLEAVAAAKANNVPYETGPAARGVEAGMKAVKQRWQAMGPTGAIQALGGRGKTQITHDPRGPGAQVKQLMNEGQRFDPLSRHPKLIHANAKNDLNDIRQIIGTTPAKIRAARR